ncbi:hypothetical protein ED733_003304 [Metarhizium rileyi]|uniref:Amidoligase enzyme n=1 Tax=Metarhizium rileyi (strain RCEF 4871) TaxID=1649241 RepID=A0A5C6G1P5_METRR|nr:hypothetical protein ED733_003304 [Metarhizium rileyi]
MGTSRLAFGIEIELLFKPGDGLVKEMSAPRKDPASKTKREGWSAGLACDLNTPKAANNRVMLREAIANHLTAAQVPASVAIDEYLQWSVLDEPVLNERPGYWRLEIVSRCIASDDDWFAEITSVFKTLQKLGTIFLTAGCSTHVHVSPSAQKEEVYTIEQMRAIIKAVAYYEQAITRVMPGNRKNNTWAVSNFQDDKTGIKYRELYNKISSDTWAPLFDALDEVRFLPLVPLEIFTTKHQSWNFKHLRSECGTLEFRRPPGVETAEEAIYWAAFALGFIKGAMTCDWSIKKMSKAHADSKALKSFVHDGLSQLRLTHGVRSYIPDIVERNDPPTAYTSTEMRVAEREKGEKHSKDSNFVVKVNSRPNTPGSSSSSS